MSDDRGADQDRTGAPATGSADPRHTDWTAAGTTMDAHGGAGADRTGHAEIGGRLHPSVIAVWSTRSLAPLIAVWVAAEAVGRSLGIVALALILVSAVVRWMRFEWRIESEQVVIEQGLLQRRRRVIPIARIQAVQTVRKLPHRLFGVVGLRIEAIGGSETEGQLDALDVDVARQVQQTLMRRSGEQPAAAAPSDADSRPVDLATPTTTVLDPPGPTAPGALTTDDTPGTIVAQCPPRMLLIAGLTGGRVGVAAAIIGLAQQVFGEQLADTALSAPERLGLVTTLVVVVVGVLAVFVLSVGATALTYWDFTVRRDGRLLRLRRGLLDERRDTVPLARVQSVTVEQNILRRALGLAAVKMVVAGRAGSDVDVTSTLMPIAGRDDALRLLGELFDVGDIAGVALTPMPPAARRRRLTRAAAAAVVAGAVGWLAGTGYAVGAVVTAAAVTVPAALGTYRALGWAHDGDVVLARSGWIVRRLTVTPVRGLQSLRLHSSPFQRRAHLTTLHLEIARTRGARDPRLLDLDAGTGEELLTALAAAQPRDTAHAHVP